MSESYNVRTDVFEGPMELLLHLIEKRKLHINDISLAKITDDYLEYTQTLKTFPLSAAAHFILIASTLEIPLSLAYIGINARRRRRH